MSGRNGVLPPDGTEDGTFHWIGAPGYSAYRWKWKSGEWIEGSLRRRPEISWFAGFYYIGPAPTHEQAQADAADARRFQWLLKRHSETEAPHDSPGVWLHDIGWTREARTADIRAAIDAAMKEQSND